jgi:hypothetical protein
MVLSAKVVLSASLDHSDSMVLSAKLGHSFILVLSSAMVHSQTSSGYWEVALECEEGEEDFVLD